GAHRGARTDAARGARRRRSRKSSRDGERLDVLAHVVDAQDRDPALVDGDRRGDARRERPGRGGLIARELAERALAREADEQRPSEREQDVEPAHELDVVLDRLAEADAGIEADALLAHSLLDREAQAHLEEGGDLAD